MPSHAAKTVGLSNAANRLIRFFKTDSSGNNAPKHVLQPLPRPRPEQPEGQTGLISQHRACGDAAWRRDGTARHSWNEPRPRFVARREGTPAG